MSLDGGLPVSLPDAVAGAIQAWAEFKQDHRVVSRLLAYSHLAGILLAGGTAITVDRGVMRAWRRAADARARVLEDLERAHRVVIPALVFVGLTGGLWTLSELDDFMASPIYWVKMGLVGLLILNGLVMLRAERAARLRPGDGEWRRLRAAAMASIALWFATLLAGRFL